MNAQQSLHRLTAGFSAKPNLDKVSGMAQKLGIPMTPELMQLGSNEAISNALVEIAVGMGKSEGEISKALDWTSNGSFWKDWVTLKRCVPLVSVSDQYNRTWTCSLNSLIYLCVLLYTGIGACCDRGFLGKVCLILIRYNTCYKLFYKI